MVRWGHGHCPDGRILPGIGVPPYSAWEDVLSGTCLIVTILQHQQSWQGIYSAECHSSTVFSVFCLLVILFDCQYQ